jgi:hypothetical protein
LNLKKFKNKLINFQQLDLKYDNNKDVILSEDSDFSFKKCFNHAKHRRKESENSKKILGKKIVRKISETKNDNYNKFKTNKNYSNYNNDFNFEGIYDSSSPKDIFLSFENPDKDENKYEILSENYIEEEPIFPKKEEINIKENTRLSEINDYKIREKLSKLKNIFSEKKYLEGSLIKSFDDNTTVSSKKTKEKEKVNKEITENTIYTDKEKLNRKCNLFYLKENEEDFGINFFDKETDKKFNSKEIVNIEGTNKTKYNKNNIFLKKENKINDTLMETAKIFNLDN